MPNSNPTLTSTISNQNATEDIFFGLDVSSHFSDSDPGDTLTYAAAGLPDGLTINANTGVISGIPTNSAVGTKNIIVTASDGNGGSINANFSITVANTNDAPTVVNPILDQAATEDNSFSLNVSSSFNDIDVGNTLTYSAAGLPDGLTINATTGVISGSPTNVAVGIHNVTVTANDGNGGSANTSFKITVANTNDAPTVATPIANRTATEDSFFSINISSNFADVDAGDTLTYSATGLPDGLTINATTGVISGSPTNAAVGVRNVVVTATDVSGSSVNAGFNITVANTNDAPTVVNPIPDQTATEDNSFNLNVSGNFSDIDVGNTLSYSATGLPDGLTINQTTGVISGSPTNAAVGIQNVTVTANDGNGSSASTSFKITVANTNDAPTVATPIPDKTATEDSFFSMNVSNNFADVDMGDVLSFFATNLPNGLSINNTTGVISGFATNAAVGNNTIIITATDSKGGTVSDSFVLTVGNTNDAPIVVLPIGDRTAREDNLFTLDIKSHFADPDVGDTLTYAAVGLPTGLSMDINTGIISGTPTNPTVGVHNITVTARDGKGGTVSNGFALTILNTNDDPTVVSAIPDRTATEDTSFTFNVSGYFTDMDLGDILSFFASGLPDGLSIDANTGIISGSPTNAAVGTNSVMVTASDGNGGTVTDSFDLMVANANDAPVVATPIGDRTATEDSQFTLNISSYFADPDVGDVLTYSASGLPDGLSIDTNTGIISGAPTNAAVGINPVTVTANDGKNGTVSHSFAMTVRNANDDPTVATPIPDQTATEDAPFTLNVSSHFADIDVGDTLSFFATGLPDGLNINSNTGLISGAPTNAAVGTSHITITVSDSNGGTVEDGFDLTVANTNDAPIVVTPIANRTATEDNLFTLNVSSNFADPDVGDTLTYSAAGLPDGLGIDTNTGVISGTPSNAAVGANNITVTANDGKGGAVSNAFTLTVANVNDDPIVTTPIGNQSTVVNVAFSLNVTSHFSDIDVGNSLTYFATGLPTGLSLDGNTGVISGNPTNLGTSTLKITANDGNGGIVDHSFDLTVVTNTAPTVITPIADLTTTANSPLTFTVNANAFQDADPGDALVLAASLETGGSLPGWLSFNPVTRTFSGTPNNTNAGTTSIRVTATDRSGVSVNDVFSLTVNAQTTSGGSTPTNPVGTTPPTTPTNPTPTPVPGVTLNGTKKDDRLTGGAGNDTLNGLAGKDTLLGEAGDDVLVGSGGNDVLNGGAGNDRIISGSGYDRVIGGADRDVFVIEKGVGWDVIQDFQDKQDLLRLGSGISFSKLKMTKSGRNTIVSFGDDQLAVLTGIKPNLITAADFTKVG